jgi:hypothetical protein
MITIGKISFRFGMTDLMFARKLYEDWDEFCRCCVTEVLDEYLSRFDRKETYIELDRLELQLGSIPQEEFHTEFPLRLRKAIERNFQPQTQHSDAISRSLAKRTENLLHYLHHGFCLPEWSDADFNLYDELCFPGNAGVLKETIRQCFTQKHWLERLERQLSEEQLAAVFARWISEEEDQTEQAGAIKTIARNHPEKLVRLLDKLKTFGNLSEAITRLLTESLATDDTIPETLRSRILLQLETALPLSEEHAQDVRHSILSWLASPSVSRYERQRYLALTLERTPQVVIRFIHECSDADLLHNMAELLESASVKQLMTSEAENHAEVDLPEYWHHLYSWLLEYYPFNGVAMFGDKKHFKLHLHERFLWFIHKRSTSVYLSKAEITVQFLLEVFGADYYLDVLKIIYYNQPVNTDGSPVQNGYYNRELYYMLLKMSLIDAPAGNPTETEGIPSLRNRTAIEQGNTTALSFLERYITERYNQNSDEIVTHLRTAIEKGDVTALSFLKQYITDPYNADTTEIIARLRAALEQGDVTALSFLEQYITERYNQNSDEIVTHLRTDIEKGDATALSFLKQYITERYNQNSDEIVTHLRTAMAKGDTTALSFLKQYITRRYNQNSDEIVTHLRTAIEQGDTTALSFLKRYITERYNQNSDEIVTHLRTAIEQGDTTALSFLEQYITDPYNADTTEIITRLRASLEKGDTTALSLLERYITERYNQNSDEIVTHLRTAIEQGDTTALSLLKQYITDWYNRTTAPSLPHANQTPENIPSGMYLSVETPDALDTLHSVRNASSYNPTETEHIPSLPNVDQLLKNIPSGTYQSVETLQSFRILEAWLLAPDVSQTDKSRLLHHYIRWQPSLLWRFIGYSMASENIAVRQWTTWLGRTAWIELTAALSLSLGETLRQTMDYLSEERQLSDELLAQTALHFVANHTEEALRSYEPSSIVRQFVSSLALTERNTRKTETADGGVNALTTATQQALHLTETAAEAIEELLQPEYIEVPNAGLCLLALWLPRLFDRLDMLSENKKELKDTDARIRAVFMLQRMVTDEPRTYNETELSFNRLLTGCPFYVPLPKKLALTDREMSTVESMLDGVKSNWNKMTNTSVKGFQQSFIERPGRLEQREDKWVLYVDTKAYDILLDSLPWSYRQIRLPWLKKKITVVWRDKETFDTE